MEEVVPFYELESETAKEAKRLGRPLAYDKEKPEVLWADVLAYFKATRERKR